MKKLIMIVLGIALLSCNKDDAEAVLPQDVEKTSTVLNQVVIDTWMYQIQNLYDWSNISKLDQTDYDMFVLEPGDNLKEDLYQTKEMVDELQLKPNGDRRILLAYIDIGEAEDYRSYWHDDWQAPTETQQGFPSFLVTVDPDGWTGNYPVAFWDTAWQNIWLEPEGIIEKLVNFGFDGVYLDWVEAYDDDKVRALAESQNLSGEAEMMEFIKKIREKGKSINPNFLIIAQNAQFLLDFNSSLYISIIDGIATEDTWFFGEGDADWNSPLAGDLSGGERHANEYSTKNRIKQNKKYLSLNRPVFTIDYCISETNANNVYSQSRLNGFIPLVSRVSLSELTETPPF